MMETIMVESIVYCILDNDKDERKKLGLYKNLWQLKKDVILIYSINEGS
jgi:hypothetical protein